MELESMINEFIWLQFWDLFVRINSSEFDCIDETNIFIQILYSRSESAQEELSLKAFCFNNKETSILEMTNEFIFTYIKTKIFQIRRIDALKLLDSVDSMRLESPLIRQGLVAVERLFFFGHSSVVSC